MFNIDRKQARRDAAYLSGQLLQLPHGWNESRKLALDGGLDVGELAVLYAHHYCQRRELEALGRGQDLNDSLRASTSNH